MKDRESSSNTPVAHLADHSVGRVRFVDLQIQMDALEPEVSRAVARVLHNCDFILGSDVEAFESEFAEYCGVEHCVGVDSGMSALELILRAADVGPGDEVITQANTFIATVASIQAVGATPVLVDCDGRGDIDVAAVADAVTPRTRAIVPVHLFGRICDIASINEIAARAGVDVFEDAAQAHGARLGDGRAGSFGLASAFSFYPGKNLGAAGDGGAVVTDSEILSDRLRTLRNYGQREKYVHIGVPMNRRLDSVQAAVLRLKLRHLDEWNAAREVLADAYRERLAAAGIDLPRREDPGRHVYHLFTIEVDGRDRLRNELSREGVETGIHYPVPCHQQPCVAHLGYRPDAFPMAESRARRTLSLPMFPELTSRDVDVVSDAVLRHCQR